MTPFSTRDEPDGLIITIDDPIGLNDFRACAVRDALYQCAESRDMPRFALDLNAVDYLSSSGVAILVGLKRRIDARGGKLVFFHVQPVVTDLLRIMKLDRYFAIADDEPAARESLRPVPTA
jgi:anti-sigma B factor antagonist